jgi:hypothetical protein
LIDTVMRGMDETAPMEDEPAPASTALDIEPSFHFDPEAVGEVLEEGFAWIAEKFGSEHWKLSDRQARMLKGPTSQLLGSLYAHIERMLPAFLERWADSTPGLMDFVFVFGIVVGPKVAKQLALSRERRRGGGKPKPAAAVRSGQPSNSHYRDGGAVGPLEEPEPIEDVEAA